MRHAFAAALASLTILGVAAVQAAPSGSSEVVQIPTSVRITPFAQALIQGCVGEPVSFQGYSLMVAHETLTPDGSLRLAMIHFNGQGAYAVGQVTGDIYQITGADTNTIVFGPSVLTASFEADLHAIGPGAANNFTAHILQHITITPSGSVTSYIDVLSVNCTAP